jgi:hypothetical protein
MWPIALPISLGPSKEGTDHDLQTFASLLDAQPPEIQEAFQFLLATAMHEAGEQAGFSAWCGRR